MKVTENSSVQIHYIGKLNNGEIFDTTYDKKQTLHFTLGTQKVIPGFERAVLGMKVGEIKEIHVPFMQAFGPINKQALYEVSKAALPTDELPEVGKSLITLTPDGQEFMVKIVEVREQTIVIDTNHPLAGQDLNFTIELVAIDKI